MPSTKVRSAYLGAMLQKAELCNNRLHQTWFWFTGLAVVGYLLSTSEAATLSILGASVPVPRRLFVGAMPLVLAALFYGMSCFAALEDLYYPEIRRLIDTAGAPGQVLSKFQLKLIEAPSFYTYSEL